MVSFGIYIPTYQRRKDGTFPIKIRVTHHRKSRLLPTNKTALSSDLSRTGNLKNGLLIDQCNELIKEMRMVISHVDTFVLESKDVGWVVDYIHRAKVEEVWHLDFFVWAKEYLSQKNVRESTKQNYEHTLHSFERFLGKDELDINDITRTMIVQFMEYVDKTPKMKFHHKTGDVQPTPDGKMKKPWASSMHIAKLANIFNAAKARYNDEDNDKLLIPRSPFATIKKTYPNSQGQKNLGADLMQRIILAKTDNPATRIALDVFVVSFALMGANIVDLYNAKAFKGDVWIYNRQKTSSRRKDGAEHRVYIPACIRPYLNRLQREGSEWWLPVLRTFGSSKDIASARVNRLLRSWAKSEGLEPFTMYAGRKTFASIARRLGVEKATIDECLVHAGEFKMADIYIERDWDLMNRANQMVLDSLVWPDD